MCANTLSQSVTRSVTVEQTVSTFGYPVGTDAKRSLEYLLTKEEAPANKCHSEDEVLDTRNFNNRNDFLALISLFQNPKYQVPI